MNKALTTNMKTLVNNNKNIFDLVYNGVNHTRREKIATFVTEAFGIKTIKQFIKFDFSEYEMPLAQLMALESLQDKLNKYMSKQTKAVAKKKVVAKREAPIGKTPSGRNKFKIEPTKQIQVALVAKKVSKKKAVAKKKTAKVSLKDKILKQYKVVTGYSENLMQDVYSVVYRTKTLKRFINTNLANKYIEQEVLLKLNEKAVASPAKIKGIKKELEQEFA